MQCSLHATIPERAHAFGIGCTVLMHGVASSAGGSGLSPWSEVEMTVDPWCLLLVVRASGTLLTQCALHANDWKRAQSSGVGRAVLMHDAASSAGDSGLSPWFEVGMTLDP